MSQPAPTSILENARVVHSNGVSVRPVAFAGGRTVASGGISERAARVDLRGHLIFPALINAHDHLHLNCIPPLPRGRSFHNAYEWIDAVEEHRETAAVAAAVGAPVAVRHWHGALKNVLCGVTTVAHHDPWHDAFDDRNFPVTVVRDAGWSHSLGLSEARDGRPPRDGPAVLESFRNTPTEQPWIIHAAEGVDAVAGAEIDRLDEMGCLAANTVIVHGVGMGENDVARVLTRGASVVWCPRSNVELFGRTLDPRPLFAAGRLALGTDSRLTGSRDLLDELREAAANSDLSAADLFHLVTTGAGTVLRMTNHEEGLDLGEPKAPGDCLILRDQGDPYRALAGAARADVRAVVRGGAPVVGDPDLADWFGACGVDATPVMLDGRPKLLARTLARARISRPWSRV